MKDNLKNDVQIDIEFETDVFIPESASNLLTSTIEYLLFQRHQIPFVFPTFKYMTSKWSINEENTYETFHLDKQRRLAMATLKECVDLCEHIKQECKQSTVHSARISFGATPLTPKEVYVVHLPPVSKKHTANNHRKAAAIATNKVIMSLLTCEKLYRTFSNSLGMTNMYVDIETSAATSNVECDNFQVKDDTDFYHKCPIIHINLIHKQPATCDINCCRDIFVYESMGDLVFNEGVEANRENTKDRTEHAEINSLWKECKVFVKGFKDVFIKGRGIWED